jgi:hypothetical protein
VESPFDGYYGEIVDPAKTLALLVAPDPEPPDPPEEPDPTPPDCGGYKVEIDRLVALVAAQSDEIKRLDAELDAAEARIVAKDAKADELKAI